MKKSITFTIFLIFFYTNICLAGLHIGYLAPSSTSFEIFSNSFLNGLYLGLSKNETVVIQNTSQGVNEALENLYLTGVDVIIGPFEVTNVKMGQHKICNSSIVTILPFAKPNYYCNNVFVYNYNPISAAWELAKILTSYPLGKTLILYSEDNLDITKKNAFLEGLQSQNAQLYIKALHKNTSYENFIRSLFGICKIRHRSSLTNQPVYKHSFNVNSIIIFAPEKDFINITNLLDYYNINMHSIFSTDIIINNNLLSLNKSILKKMEFITPYYLCSNDPTNMKFVKQYDLEYQKDPNFMAALGYDIGRLLNNTDRVSLLTKLKQTADFDGLIGRLLFFDDSGNGFINYKILTYKDIERCRKIILNK